MKKLLLGLIVVIATIAAVWQSGHAQSQQTPEFRVVVEAIPDGLNVRCVVGCTWNRATFACGPQSVGKLACKIEIDEEGTRPPK